jgi:hypothetical protein
LHIDAVDDIALVLDASTNSCCCYYSMYANHIVVALLLMLRHVEAITHAGVDVAIIVACDYLLLILRAGACMLILFVVGHVASAIVCRSLCFLLVKLFMLLRLVYVAVA